MNKWIFCLLPVLLFAGEAMAQPKTKPAAANAGVSKQAEKMMEDAMKAQGMSREEIAEMKKQLAEAQKTTAELKEKGLIPGAVVKTQTQIPSKRTALLVKIPRLTGSDQYSAYIKQLLADCKSKIEKAVIAEVDAAFAKQSNDMAAEANLVPAYLIKGKANAAIYAAAKAAAAYPDNKNIQNNLGVTLHQTGYAHKAIPVLQYLNDQQNDPVIGTSLGHAYLSLGDTAKARGFFMAAMRAAPDNVSALSGTALILDAGGKKTEAAAYIKKAMKNGYSKIADELAKKNNVKFKFSEIRQEVPEYFNAQKFKPAESATDAQQVRPFIAKRYEMDQLFGLMQEKYDEFAKTNEAELQKGGIAKMIPQYAGFLGAVTGTGGVMTAKAQMMYEALIRDHSEFIGGRYYDEMTRTEATNHAEHKLLQEKVRAVPHTTLDEDCRKKTELLNRYLQKTAYARDQAIRNTLHQDYDYANQVIYWLNFLVHGDEYKKAFLSTRLDLMDHMRKYNELQLLYPEPESIVYGCDGPTKTKDKKPQEDSATAPETECPVQFEIPMGMAKMKLSCESFSVEGGELFQGSFERKFNTGEMTIFVGLGVGFYEKGGVIGGIGGGVEAGAKAGVFVTVDGSGNVIDCGDQAEVSIEGGIGPLITEAKLTGVLGMQSGGRLETSVAGNESVIWSTEK